MGPFLKRPIPLNQVATMSKTIKAAFDLFRADVVDLDANKTEIARKSRDHLLAQLRELSVSNTAFPKFTAARELFGSFARNTKIRPLDDIDIMPILDPTGLTLAWSDGTPRLKVAQPTAPLAPWADDGYVNSRRLLGWKFDSGQLMRRFLALPTCIPIARTLGRCGDPARADRRRSTIACRCA